MASPGAHPAAANIKTATHSFTGTNADELSFAAGDAIEILQEASGGWWEGRKGEASGWFPCNHVANATEPAEPATTQEPATPTASPSKAVLAASMSPEASEADQDQGLQRFFNSENFYVTALAETNRALIVPLDDVDWLDDNEKALLVEPFGMVLAVHQAFLRSLAQELSRMKASSKLADCFLDFAQELAMVDCGFCALHPQIDALVTRRCADAKDPLAQHLGGAEQVVAFRAALKTPVGRLAVYTKECRKLNIINLTTDTIGLEPKQLNDVVAAFQSINDAVKRIAAAKLSETLLKASQIRCAARAS